MFFKLQKTGGGVLHMGCIHSVVYYESALWWQESARDHGDALLSFRHPPTVYISDITGHVARHLGPVEDSHLGYKRGDKFTIHLLSCRSKPNPRDLLAAHFQWHCFLQSLKIYAYVYQSQKIKTIQWLQCLQDQGFCGLQVMRLILVLPRLPKRNKTLWPWQHINLFCGTENGKQTSAYQIMKLNNLSTHAAVRKGQVVELVAEDEILMLQNDLRSGALKSNQMYLHNNPTFDPKLKQQTDASLSLMNNWRPSWKGLLLSYNWTGQICKTPHLF
ncbi:hypothetical protein MHYP_G00029450 [Metynnis hypsauchen]